ncbi:PKD domain-containing protein [Deminuibacter soli]|nr:PKD domain-containing protein [Deminuibacter soli]
MKTFFLFVFLLALSAPALAGHIAGGEMYYRYVGPGTSAQTNRYEITLRMFRQCNPPMVGGQQLAQLPQSANITVFDLATSTPVASQQVLQDNFTTLSLLSPLPCIQSYSPVCYQVATYVWQTDLPINASGYTAAFQTCCRSNSLVNIVRQQLGNNSTGEGATYACDIPGTLTLGTEVNSSAVFGLKDTVLVCQYKNIHIDFSATDPDVSDSLSYALCGAYNRGDAQGADSSHIASRPPYQNVSYTPGFSGSTPMGPNITIDPVTGIIQGRAPANGGYVVNVCVTEWRNHKAISVHRKDFMMSVQACDFAAADLPASYIDCTDQTLNFANESTSSQVHSYLWDFGVTTMTSDTSNLPTPSFTYPDTGTFTVKLVINRSEQCSDSALVPVKVYPGFKPAFTVVGSCVTNPYRFTDGTTSRYGVVNNWRWDFGDADVTNDTSLLRNPSYKYNSVGDRSVQLIVGDSKGCLDTLSQTVKVEAKLQIDLPFRDTLICSIDTLQLHASSNGTFLWSPTATMIDYNTPDPKVFPKDTTVYYVNATYNGCTNTDSVRVNVLDSITVKMASDTTICRTDSVQFHPVSYGLQYLWDPAGNMNDATLKSPAALPLTNTLYHVIAHLGKCVAEGSINVKVVPYPISKAVPDATICYGSTVALHGDIVGSSFKWVPANSLQDANTLTPIAGPTHTTPYILYAYDTLGCPKPGLDTAIVTVIPQVHPFAGRDTAVVKDQPLQFQATGGVYYTWTPSTGLSNPSIANPIGLYDGSYDSIRYQVRVATAEGCYADTSVLVKIFRPYPEIYVPSAFSPNHDGKNDVLRPIPVGVQRLVYFRVFDRWGNLIFSTSEINKGWDGQVKGQPALSGTYVYTVEGIDYKNAVIVRKGTFVLIR